jgi:DNA-binding NarL/FixJ family response regulator
VKRTRVVLADDHAVLREGLRALIAAQPDFEVAGEAATGQEAVACAAQTTPAVLCLDLSMPGGGVAATIHNVKTVSPRTRVLILSMHSETAYVRSALAAGADGYVLKSSTTHVLLSGLRGVARGEHVLDPALGDLQADTKPSEAATLSRREREVIALLARGHTHQEIADKLLVSVKSVETYRARVREKLGLRTRADFVRYGLEAGLLTDSHAESAPPD